MQNIEGTTQLCPPQRDLGDPGVKIIRAKFRRHIEDYLRYVRRFGQTFTSFEIINGFKHENGAKGRGGRLKRGNRFRYEIINDGLEANEYIFNSNENDSLLSFESACNFLGVDPHGLRRKLANINNGNAAQILGRFHKMYGH